MRQERRDTLTGNTWSSFGLPVREETSGEIRKHGVTINPNPQPAK